LNVTILFALIRKLCESAKDCFQNNEISFLQKTQNKTQHNVLSLIKLKIWKFLQVI